MSASEALIRKRRVSDADINVPPPALTLVPPPAQAVVAPNTPPVTPDITVPPPSLRLVPSVNDQPANEPEPAIAVPSAIRPRYAMGEPDPLTKASENLAALQKPIVFDDARDSTGAYVHPDAYHTPSRGRAFLLGALSHLGTAMAHAQARADAQGRRPDWSDVASGAVEALGSGVGTALDPKSIVEQQRATQVAQAQQQYGQAFQQRAQQAQLGELESKPILAAAQIAQKNKELLDAHTEKQIDNLRDTWKHLPEYKRGDPKFKALDDEANRLGVTLPDFQRDTPPKNPVTKTDEVTGKTSQWNDEKKTWEPAPGLPDSPRINVPGLGLMKPSEAGAAGARQDAINNQYSNETYGDQVRQTDRDNAAAQRRRAEASVAVGQLQAAIKAAQKAAALVNNPPVHRAGNNVYSAEPDEVNRYREEYDKAKALVDSLGANVRQNYGDLVQDDPETKYPILLQPAPAPTPYPSRQAPQTRGIPNATPSNVQAAINRLRNRN